MKRKKLNLILIPVIILTVIIITGCPKDREIGVGPIKSVTLKELDKNLADKGKQIFDTKCVICHKMDSKLVGPSLQGITQRRRPEWIMNMILNPEQMIKEDKTAKQLFSEYLQQMTYQGVTEDDARAILEYFRMVDGAK